MKEAIATITSKGQLTVPIEVRRHLGLKQGDRVVFQLDEGQEVRLTPATSRLARGYQSIPALAEPKDWDEIEEIVADERAEHATRQLRKGRPS